MDWLKKNFDRVMLAVIALLVIAFAALIIVNAMSFGELFLEKNSRKPADNTLPQPDTEFIRNEITSVAQPAEWVPTENSGSLFVSDPYIVKENKLHNPMAGDEMLHPPVPNSWINQYDLEYWRGDLLEEDPDNDKFTNLEEFRGKTDPTSPTSMPPFATKLRLAEFVQTPFRLKFSGSPDDGESFSINTLDLRQPTQFLKLGEMVNGTPYKLISYEPKTKDKNGLQVDVSELTVENQETGEKIVLIYDTVVNSPNEFADFKYLWDGSTFRVKKNDSFSLEPEKSVTYKLIDINNSRALIKRSDSGQEFEVPAENP